MWLPQPSRPQLDAYYSEADLLLFGGAAGGSKSELLLGLALTQHRDSILFRREYSQMVGSSGLIARSKQIIGKHGRYNAQEHTWRDLPGGRTLEFGACQYEETKQRYRGRPHSFIGIDECAEFTESIVRFLIAWLRTTDINERCRVVMCSNPPTSTEGAWLFDMFGPWIDVQHPNPARPGELRWFTMINGVDTEVDGPDIVHYNEEELKPKSRSFIPARVSDNPYLYETDYESTLQGLPEPLRSQLLYGDFSLTIGTNQWQVIPTAWVQMAQARWKQRQDPREARLPTSIGLDPARGGKDKTVISELYGTWFAPLHKYAGKDTPDGPSVAALIAELYNGYRSLADGWNEDFDVTELPINCDVIGIGSSCVDTLEGNDFYVNSVNFAEKSHETDRSGQLRLRNVRAEAYWSLREALDPDHGDNIALPPDRELLRDLTAPTYKLTISGILVESKKDIRARLGRSPDCGDAVVLAHYLSHTGPIIDLL